MKLNKTKYIGIDIGGAHLKCIGIDKNKNITYTKYFLMKCGLIKIH